MGNILFDIKGLTYYYNGHRALDIPSLQFEKGEIYLIAGPNGAGKTTLLNILSFLLKPASGSIVYEGLDVREADLLKLRREVTLVQQAPYLFSTTVEKNIAYGLIVRRTDRDSISDKVTEALKMVGLDGLRDRMAGGLSGGEAKRVALARAFVLRPKVLLLDEPLAHLDAGHTEIIENTVKEFNRLYGTTVILTTHNLLQGGRLSDRVVIMKEGQVLRHRNL